jgi:diguanylate cyclase (GGDEF)-like protein
MIWVVDCYSSENSYIQRTLQMIVRGQTTQKAGRVLVINSDPEIIRILEVNLAHANLEVVSAQSGAEALQKILHDQSDIIIFDPELSDVESSEIFHHVREAPGDTPIILLSTRGKKRNKATKTEDVTIYYIDKPFDPKEVVALVQGYLLHKERRINVDPLTGLPNRIQVNKEIARLIEARTTFAFVYISMHDFKAVNRAYGYPQGDRVIQLLADIVSEAVRLFGNPGDLVGHFAGDKFVVVSTPWKARTLCRRVIADYNRRIKSLFTEEHLQVGHAALENPSDTQEQPPNLSLHIAVVTNQKRTFNHHLEVIENALEQMAFLKRSPESNCFFDLRVNAIEPPLALTNKEVINANKEELRAVQSMLAWLDFLTGELERPLGEMKNRLRSFKSRKEENLSRKQISDLKSVQESYHRLVQVAEGLANLTKSEALRSDALFDTIDVMDTFGWVLDRVQALAKRKSIKTDVEMIGDIGRIIGDKKSLVQGLLYIIRHEIQSSPKGSHLHIRLGEKNEEYLSIKINNPDHYIPAPALNTLLRGQTGASRQETLKNELYPARVLVRALGGKSDVTSDKGNGTTYHLTIPKKWQSWMSEVNTLQLAMDISRKEARDTIRNIQRLVASLAKPVPPAITEAYETLNGKVQELAVLCNRSLFLAEDLNSRLEIQLDRLLQQESEQMATSEAILKICRDMIRSMKVKNLFDPESGRRVVRYTLAIARELKMSDAERQALYHAAILKDIALAFIRPETFEQMVSGSREMIAVLKERLNLVWKALADIPFYSPACNLLLYRFERYDGSGGSFGARGADIPLGSRILAVADTFDLMTSAHSPQGKMMPKLAVQKIVEESGRSFDPHVISALLMLWRGRELNAVLNEVH